MSLLLEIFLIRFFLFRLDLYRIFPKATNLCDCNQFNYIFTSRSSINLSLLAKGRGRVFLSLFPPDVFRRIDLIFKEKIQETTVPKDRIYSLRPLLRGRESRKWISERRQCFVVFYEIFYIWYSFSDNEKQWRRSHLCDKPRAIHPQYQIREKTSSELHDGWS